MKEFKLLPVGKERWRYFYDDSRVKKSNFNASRKSTSPIEDKLKVSFPDDLEYSFNNGLLQPNKVIRNQNLKSSKDCSSHHKKGTSISAEKNQAVPENESKNTIQKYPSVSGEENQTVPQLFADPSVSGEDNQTVLELFADSEIPYESLYNSQHDRTHFAPAIMTDKKIESEDKKDDSYYTMDSTDFIPPSLENKKKLTTPHLKTRVHRSKNRNKRTSHSEIFREPIQCETKYVKSTSARFSHKTQNRKLFSRFATKLCPILTENFHQKPKPSKTSSVFQQTSDLVPVDKTKMCRSDVWQNSSQPIFNRQSKGVFLKIYSKGNFKNRRHTDESNYLCDVRIPSQC